MLQTISASKLKIFKTCQRQYYYKYVLHPDKRPDAEYGLSALLGSSIHKAIECYYRNGDEPLLVFQEQFAGTYAQWIDEGRIVKGEEWFTKSLSDGKSMLRKFEWGKWKPKELEYRFTLPFPNKTVPLCNINGYIDFIDKCGNGIVIDFKTSNKMPKSWELDNDPQFIIYAWAYLQIYGVMPDKVYWYHLRNQRLLESHVLDNYQLKLEQLTYDIHALLQSSASIGIIHHQRRSIDEVCKKQCSFYRLCYGEDNTNGDE